MYKKRGSGRTRVKHIPPHCPRRTAPQSDKQSKSRGGNK